MPRYDDRYGNTRLYIGHLSSRTRSRDLESLFSRYGRVRDVDMKYDYAFVEFSDPRDADDARYRLDGRELHGSRIIVEFAKGVPRGAGGSREYLGKGPAPGSGRCFNCGIDGHWARDCKAGDWKNKCYRCGERGHIERNCQNSPKKLSKRGRSYSRSPVRSHSPPRGRRSGRSYSRSPSRSRSYSRSRSPVKRELASDHEEKRLKSSSRNRSPEPKRYSSPAPKANKRSLTPEEGSLRERASPTPNEDKHMTERNGSDYSESPRAKSTSPVSAERDNSPIERSYRSPSEGNGHNSHRSPIPSPKDDGSPVEDGAFINPSPRDERSPVDDDEDDDNRRYARGSESS